MEAAPLEAVRPTSACRDPLDVLAALGAVGGRRALLESAGALHGEDRPPTLRRSLLVARPLLHLELRGGRCTWRTVAEGSGRLLEGLASLFPEAERSGDALTVRLPDRPPVPPEGGLLTDDEVLKAPSVLDALRATLRLLGDRGPAFLPPGLFGAFAHDLVDHFEALPPRRPDPLDEPDGSFVLAGDVVVWDHANERVHVTTRALPWEEARRARERHAELLAAVEGRSPEPAPATPDEPVPGPRWTSEPGPEAFARTVEAFREEIAAGEIFQGVPSRHFVCETAPDPLTTYRVLRERNPSPYMFHVDLGDGVLLGASPETCVRVEDGYAEIRPIAGTAPRGRRPDASGGSIDPELDSRLALALQLDAKEQAEHCMLVDLARNDVARVSAPGTTRVVQQLAVERYSHVQHLVSRVRGRLREGLDALHAYRASANMGTLTGAPKVRAMELVREAEPTGRGFYGGALGYLLRDGRFDSCIVIRSARFAKGAVHTRTGAGVVFDSVPEREVAETEHKAGAVRDAVGCALAASATAGGAS